MKYMGWYLSMRGLGYTQRLASKMKISYVAWDKYNQVRSSKPRRESYISALIWDHMHQDFYPFKDSSHVKMCLVKDSHSEIWRSPSRVFTKQAWSTNFLHLKGTMNIIIELKWNVQVLLFRDLPTFIGLSVLGGRLFYRINSPTIKRGFQWEASLIASIIERSRSFVFLAYFIFVCIFIFSIWIPRVC
jgi:hypothetical protein